MPVILQIYNGFDQGISFCLLLYTVFNAFNDIYNIKERNISKYADIYNILMSSRFKQIYPNLKLKDFLDLLYVEDSIISTCKQLEFDTKFF